MRNSPKTKLHLRSDAYDDTITLCGLVYKVPNGYVMPMCSLIYKSPTAWLNSNEEWCQECWHHPETQMKILSFIRI